MPETNDDVAQKTKARIIEALGKDKHLLERMQKQIAADPRGLDFLEVTLDSDGTGILVHQTLNKKRATEGRKL
ncbi:MAG: hypothetical protein ABJH07_16720 [Sedimentitalea sp.]|uniref:hypothetical protein n=1 Tax=Sedimentitalea sp. TaxID=2048915 RepID=UPI003263C173